MNEARPYPAVDLSDEKVLQKQHENIAAFKIKQKRVLFGVLGIVLSFFVGFNVLPEEQAHFAVFAMFLFGIPTVFFMILYKCPHCGRAPAGRAYSMGLDGIVNYSKGIHPLPKRCTCCGYYLSKGALESDLGAMNV